MRMSTSADTDVERSSARRWDAMAVDASRRRCERLLQQGQALLELLVRDRQRGQEPDHVAVEAAGEEQQAALERRIDDRLRPVGRPLGRARTRSSGRDPRTSPIAGCPAAMSSSRVRSCSPSRAASGEELGIAHRLENRDRGGARERVAAERPAEPAGRDGVHQLGAPRDGRERQAAADRLARDEQVGLDALVVLDRPHLPGATRRPTAPRRRRRGSRARGTAPRAARESPAASGTKPPSPCTGSSSDAGDGLRVDLGLEELLHARRSRRRSRRRGTGTAPARGRPRARTARSLPCTGAPCSSSSSSAASGRGRRCRRRRQRAGRWRRARS